VVKSCTAYHGVRRTAIHFQFFRYFAVECTVFTNKTRRIPVLGEKTDRKHTDSITPQHVTKADSH